MTIKEWQTSIHNWAKSKGWYDTERMCGDFLSNIHCEISEAWQEFRNGQNLNEVYYKDIYSDQGIEIDIKPEGFPIELADAVIRIFDYAEFLEIDLEAVMKEKMQYNERREYRHGGKKV